MRQDVNSRSTTHTHIRTALMLMQGNALAGFMDVSAKLSRAEQRMIDQSRSHARRYGSLINTPRCDWMPNWIRRQCAASYLSDLCCDGRVRLNGRRSFGCVSCFSKHPYVAQSFLLFSMKCYSVLYFDVYVNNFAFLLWAVIWKIFYLRAIFCLNYN